jgi:hypothetical protein
MYRLSLILALLMLVIGTANADPSFRDETALLDHEVVNASTVAWGDIDNDGQPDLFVGGRDGATGAIFLNHDGQFERANITYGFQPPTNILNAQFVDFDGDGLLDLCLLTNDGFGVRLYRQNEQHLLTEVLHGTGLLYTTPPRSAIWADVNNDGRLDLILTSGGGQDANLTVMEQTAGDFAAMRANPFDETLADVGAISAMDYDRDGAIDLLVGSASGTDRPHLYRNRGDGTFDDYGQRFGFAKGQAATATCWLDFNNDQKMDLYMPGAPNGNGLYAGTCLGGMIGLVPVPDMPDLTLAGANAVYAYPVDANMDGWTDLFLMKSGTDGCALLINDQGIAWRDVASNARILNADRENLSAAWADYDNDGLMDVAIAQGANGVRLFRNVTQTRKEHFQVRLLGHDVNTPVTGCTVTMQFERCKQIATTSALSCGSGWSDPSLTLVSRNSGKSHVAELVVNWPNSQTSVFSLNELSTTSVNELHMPGAENHNQQVILPPPTPPQPPTMTASPNPFNPTTSIGFTLDEAANVDLRVYDLMGREVATLARGEYASGEHHVTFDAGNLPSGIYFSRLTSGNTSTMTRLMLLK